MFRKILQIAIGCLFIVNCYAAEFKPIACSGMGEAVRNRITTDVAKNIMKQIDSRSGRVKIIDGVEFALEAEAPFLIFALQNVSEPTGSSKEAYNFRQEGIAVDTLGVIIYPYGSFLEPLVASATGTCGSLHGFIRRNGAIFRITPIEWRCAGIKDENSRSSRYRMRRKRIRALDNSSSRTFA